ncbi:MAG: methionyl-tRNA formyltransferase [Deltaproteobacteria bacterium]|nr:methionyl-tRNA formyltransferase [Deltaproteobacteria bacterium]
MTHRLRIVFMGSPDFSVPSLRALHARHDVVGVVTQPDRPKGRGKKMASPPVKIVAEELGVPSILQPTTLRRREVRDHLAALEADCFVVVAFGQILRPKILALPCLGCVNVHGSLLPRHRGPAPIQWAVLDGDRKSGVTIMLMDEGIDTGPTLLARSIEAEACETAGSLHDRLAPLGASALLEALDGLVLGTVVPTAQPETGATHARMLTKSDGAVDWTWPAVRVDRWIRGMDPWPGSFTDVGGARLKLFASTLAVGRRGDPGVISAIDDRGILVGAGDGAALWVTQLQLPGRKRMSAEALAAGRAIAVGTRLGS